MCGSKVAVHACHLVGERIIPPKGVSRKFIREDGASGSVAHCTLLARRRENGAYTLFERREPSKNDPRPLASALSRTAVFESVDFDVHDAVVVRENRETTYLVVPFSIPTADSFRTVGGACIAPRPEAGLSEAYLRGWVHAMKEVLGDAIETGVLSERAARTYFAERVRAFGDVTEVIVP